MQALYDFTGEPGTSELSINAGEILTVIRDNVGDGWCEGVNQSGKSGLFPAAYVQLAESTATSQPMSGMYTLANNIIIDNIRNYLLLFINISVSTTSSQQGTGDYWDDDWDDDSEAGHDTPAYAPQANHQPQQTPQLVAQPAYPDYTDSISTHAVHSVISERPISNVPKRNTKFSTLIKSNEDSFLMGTKIVTVPDNERVYIEENEQGQCVWVPTRDSYNCVITSPKKESKLKGLKSFIVYQLTPTVR